MALSDEQVRHVARLARVRLTDAEAAELSTQLSEILAYAEQVGEVATADVAPTSHPYPLSEVARPDEPAPSLRREELLANAPDVEQERFAVPRIVEEEA